MPLPKMQPKIFISMTEDNFMYEMHAYNSLYKPAYINMSLYGQELINAISMILGT